MKERTLTKWVLGLCGAALLCLSSCDFIPGTDLGQDDSVRSGGSSAVDGQAGGGSTGGDQAPAGQTGTLRILLTDKPFPLGLIQEATITITRIEARLAGDEVSSSVESESGDDENDNAAADTDGDNENDNEDDAGSDGLSTTEDNGANPSGFVLLFEGEQTFSLLELRNGQTAVLANATLATGSYSEIRLIVTSGSITLAEPDNRTFELTVPSGRQTGIKLKLNFDVQAEAETVLLADFDLSRSFKPIPGSGLQGPSDIREFKFSPTLRLSNLDQSATLSGQVTDDQANPLADVTVTVHRGDDEVTSTFTEADGSYQVLGLDAGTYRLEFALDGFEDAELADLSLEAGQTKEDVDVSLLADG